MILVKLLTKQGEFVTNLQVPPFNPMPEGVLWGSRTFFYVNDTEYREGLLYGATANLAVDAECKPAASFGADDAPALRTKLGAIYEALHIPKNQDLSAVHAEIIRLRAKP